MPLSFFRILKFANLVPTQVVLQLINQLVRYLMGIVEDMLVKIGKFSFLVYFIILDMKKDISMPISW